MRFNFSGITPAATKRNQQTRKWLRRRSRVLPVQLGQEAWSAGRYCGRPRRGKRPADPQQPFWRETGSHPTSVNSFRGSSGQQSPILDSSWRGNGCQMFG